jgi:hypothetical protein
MVYPNLYLDMNNFLRGGGRRDGEREREGEGTAIESRSEFCFSTTNRENTG